MKWRILIFFVVLIMSKALVSGGENGLYTATILKTDGGVEEKEAWCADLTEDLSGVVGVIEIAGDIDNGVNIQPGYEGNAVYNAERDGEMKKIEPFPTTKPPSEVYWNWAMFPGWQKWVHPYRYGVVSDIDHDANTCTVTLDPCYATDMPDGKQLDVNQESVVTAEFEYMWCNSGAFDNGDHVIVKFEHGAGAVWTNPKVIGFKEEPKSCYWEPFSGPDVDSKNPWVQMAVGTSEIIEDKLHVTGETNQLYSLVCNISPPKDVTKLTIKVDSASISGTDCYIGLSLPSPSDDIYVFAGNVSLIDSDWHFVGTGEIEINLSADGIDLPLDRITIVINGITISSASAVIDYIDLT